MEVKNSRVEFRKGEKMRTRKHKPLIAHILAVSLVWLILSAGDVALSAWKPPIGIPAPSFGIEKTHLMFERQTYDFGSGPEPYKDTRKCQSLLNAHRHSW